MKITVNQLRKIIKEEVSRALNEAVAVKALPTSLKEYLPLIVGLLSAAGAPKQFIMQIEREGSGPSGEVEVGWTEYEDQVYLEKADDADKWDFLANAAYNTVINAADEYVPGEGPELNLSIAIALARAVEKAIREMADDGENEIGEI